MNTLRTLRDFEAYERQRDNESAPEPKDEPELHKFILDHYKGAQTWGAWTEGGTLIKQAALDEVLEALERWEAGR
jgi:hypothetical protein